VVPSPAKFYQKNGVFCNSIKDLLKQINELLREADIFKEWERKFGDRGSHRFQQNYM